MITESCILIGQRHIFVINLKVYVIHDKKTYFNVVIPHPDHLTSPLVSVGMYGHDWASLATSNQH